MMRFIRPRLRVPVGIAVAGTVLAAAWLVHGGYGWLWAIVVEVSMLVRVISVYVRGGKDSDEGALAGSRADERLKLLSLRSRALAGNVAMIAAFAGLTIAIAARAAWWWPFLVMLTVTGFANLFGWSAYGVGEEGPADDANAGHETRSPVSW